MGARTHDAQSKLFARDKARTKLGKRLRRAQEACEAARAARTPPKRLYNPDLQSLRLLFPNLRSASADELGATGFPDCGEELLFLDADFASRSAPFFGGVLQAHGVFQGHVVCERKVPSTQCARLVVRRHCVAH